MNSRSLAHFFLSKKKTVFTNPKHQRPQPAKMLLPNVKWAQRRDRLFLTIDIQVGLEGKRKAKSKGADGPTCKWKNAWPARKKQESMLRSRLSLPSLVIFLPFRVAGVVSTSCLSPSANRRKRSARSRRWRNGRRQQIKTASKNKKRSIIIGSIDFDASFRSSFRASSRSLCCFFHL
mgnify:CR=1 FL=1|jgi:hypothetical protein